MTAVKATIRNPGEFTEGISPVKFIDRKVYGQLNISISGGLVREITFTAS